MQLEKRAHRAPKSNRFIGLSVFGSRNQAKDQSTLMIRDNKEEEEEKNQTLDSSELKLDTPLEQYQLFSQISQINP